MKFLDNLLWKPIGKGLAEADTFMRREMPFNMSWGFPAALAATYFGGPAVLKAIGGSTGGAGSILGSGGSGAGSMTAGNSMLANYGLDAGKNFIASNGANFSLPSLAYTPEYLNLLAKNQGVDLGDPTLFQRFTGNTEQGLYNPNQMNPSKLLGQLLKNQGKSRQQVQQEPMQQIMQQQTMPQQSAAEFEDLNEPFYDQNMTQQERSRRLLAQQLRLLRPKMAQRPQFNNTDIQSLLSSFKI
jgi:hypothetical protein